MVVGPQADRSDSENGLQKDRSENEMLERPSASNEARMNSA